MPKDQKGHWAKMRRGPISNGNSLSQGQEVEVGAGRGGLKMMGYCVQTEGGALERWARPLRQNSVIPTLTSKQFSTMESFKHRRDKIKYVFTKLFPGVT